MRGTADLASDLAELQKVEQRFAGTEAERRMLELVRSRLPDGMASRVEGFVGHPSPLFVLGVHGLFSLLGGALGYWYPRLGALVCLLTAASLVGEGSGRLGLLRLWLPRVASYNLVLPDERGGTVGTIVISTPLDVPRAQMWRPSWLRRPVAASLWSSVLITALLLLRSLAEPWGRPLMGLYLGSVVVMALTASLVWISRREPRHVAADAGGVAVTLELLRRLADESAGDLQVWTVFTGCGRAHQDGMEAFLRLRGQTLPQPLLVLSLNDAARAPLSAVTTEGPILRQHHLPTGPALVERLRWAGMRIPEVDRPEPSDARAAMILGFRALCLAGGSSEPSVGAAARAADITEAVVRSFAKDLAGLATVRPEPLLLEEDDVRPTTAEIKLKV